MENNPENVQSENPKFLHQLSVQELATLLKPKLDEYELPQTLDDVVRYEGINGKAFKRLKPEYVKTIFPDLTKAQMLSLMYLRDDLCSTEDANFDIALPPQLNRQGQQNTIFTSPLEINKEEERILESCDIKDEKGITNLPAESSGYFRETFRPFDKTQRRTHSYKRNAMLTSYNTRPSNFLDPVHIFSNINPKEQNLYELIGNNVAEFAAACLNERSNGTIHFGVEPRSSEFQIDGEIVGIQLDRDICLSVIYDILDERFYKDQIPLVQKCLRPPQFVEVTSPEKLPYKLWVLEVDVIPQSVVIGEEAFFAKARPRTKESGLLLYLFKENGIVPQSVSDQRSIDFMKSHKHTYSEARKEQEKKTKIVMKPDLRQKILELVSSGYETISAAMYPLIFVSPFDSSVGSKVDFNVFDFLIDLDANAIFDFDFSAGSNLFEFLENVKEQVLKALTTDNFDPNSEENQQNRESHNNLLEDIRWSVIKPWIFCNGYEHLGKAPMSIMEWKQNRSKGFREAIRFYRNEIPVGRGLIFFFLFSKGYEVMLEAANDVIMDFKDQWVMFAESEEIANHWCTELHKRHIVDKDTINQRTVVGMPWTHISQTFKQLTGSKRSSRCEIPTSTGAFCYLKEKKKNELCDLEILSRNECENQEWSNDEFARENLRQEEEEKFYKGGDVSWWNFWFADHVLKRDVHDRLKDKVLDALAGKKLDDDNKIGLVNIFHQPGAGGSTTARHILWDLKDNFRCCIVKQITEQTIDQVTAFRSYEETDDPKPLLVLIENRDDEKVAEISALLQHRARIIARRNNDVKVFCVLLLCTRRANIPAIGKSSEALKHELSQKELQWFSNKHRELEKQYETRGGPDPRFLISFNILKENFNSEYIKNTAAELVKGVTDINERKLLKYLSMLNTFDLEWSPVPVSAFDPIMTSSYNVSFRVTGSRTKQLNKCWEQTMSQPLQILLNINMKAGFGGQLKGLSMINAVFAAEIFSCFNQPPKTSAVFLEFFNSLIFKSKNRSRKDLEKIVRNIMKKREDKDDSRREQFSPLIMSILKGESEESATKVLIKGFEMTDDPMICQQVARLYIHCKNWKGAAKYAQIATDMKPYNSFLWDTYGQVYKNELYNKYAEFSQEEKQMSVPEIEEVIDIAQRGIEKFKKCQEVSEKERCTKVNDAGYHGELRMIILLLDTLNFCSLGKSRDDLHTFLVDKDYTPEFMPKLKPESISFIKSLEKRVDITMKMIEDKTTQFKDDKFYSVFGQQDTSRKGVASVRENLDSYFGEESNMVPENYSENDKADFRRRRVKRLGGRTLYNFLRIAEPPNLTLMLDLLLENMKSECWQPFDAVSLINTVLAMKILKIGQTKVTYSDLVKLTRRCYEMVSADRRTYLEAYMYFVLFNWPTESRQSQTICPVEDLKEATKKWKEAFLANHPRQKDGTPLRQKERTIFFLGQGKDMNTVVHYDELIDPQGKKFVRGDKVWESEDFVNKLFRLPGTLVGEGTDISCKMEQRSGGTTSFHVPTSFPIGSRFLWQKRVYFVLGFSWAGIKAYDVRQDRPVAALVIQHQHNPHNIYQTSSKKPPIQTHESFMQKLGDLNRQIDEIKSKMTQEPGRDRVSLYHIVINDQSVFKKF